MSNIRFITKFISTLFMGCVLCTTASAAGVPLDRVVAVVNSTVITQSQLDIAMKDVVAGLQMTGQPIPDQAEIKKRALDQLVLKNLQLAVAARNKMTVSDKQVTDAITKIAEENHMTLDQLKEAVGRQGLNYNRFRSQIHDQILIHSMQQSLFGSNIKITDQEVKDYMKKLQNQPSTDTQYYVDDLLVALSDQAAPAEVATAQKTAQTLMAQAQQGKSLSDLVANSPAGTNIQHADLGWRKMSDLPAIFAQAISGATSNTVKGPIRAPNGFHVLKVISVRGDTKPVTETEAKNLLFQEKVKVQIDNWLEQLKKSAYIKIM